MAITQANKNPGDLLRSSDWNELLVEAKRLDDAKFDKSGGAIGGNLSIGGALAVGTNQFGGSLNVVSGIPVQLRLQQTKNNDWARLLMNANGNEWQLGVGAPGAGPMAGNLNFWTVAGNRNALSITPAGNVGVGVELPNTPLHVRGGNWDVTATEGDLKIGNDTHRLKIGIALAGGGAGDVRIRAVGGTNRLMLGGGNNDVMLITQDGGASMPSANLSFGATVRQMINLWSTEYGIGVQSGTTYFRSWKNFAWHTGGAHNDAELNPGGGTLAMALTGSDLRVTGSIYAGNSDIYFTKTDHNHSGIGNAVGSAAIENATDYGALMLLGRTVQFRILNQTITQRVVKLWDVLEVNGTARKTNGGAWDAISDGRLKQNVAPLTCALDQLLQLRGVTFEWRDPANIGGQPGRHRGMIAQEVEQVFPEWVNITPEGYKTVGVHGFEALVIEALRELKAELDALKQVSR
jgi:hypothetical protein